MGCLFEKLCFLQQSCFVVGNFAVHNFVQQMLQNITDFFARLVTDLQQVTAVNCQILQREALFFRQNFVCQTAVCRQIVNAVQKSGVLSADVGFFYLQQIYIIIVSLS